MIINQLGIRRQVIDIKTINISQNNKIEIKSKLIVVFFFYKSK